MNLREKRDKKNLNQQISDFDISHPLVKQNQTALHLGNLENEKDFDIKRYGIKVISTFLIFSGVYLTYTSSLIIFQVFIANLAHISTPLALFLAFISGLILTVLGVEKSEKKIHFSLYSIVPVVSLVLGFIFTLAPPSWHGKLFGEISLLTFPLILFMFYWIKERFESQKQ